ncbi:hypothetical protein CTI12_AA610580 [Artemisia annua]|uniref:RNA-directed DNA polymerase, eukaryota, Reverse transcriptase zinc-binding domain protein n=1 Tax=Artemisia annua TaxID=35608 RepID=A0A2U1KF30_ARTAN|nr:hypothetical protein CTI12_AA610580 [Artemisia annua]
MYLGLPNGSDMHICDGWSEVVDRLRDKLPLGKQTTSPLAGGSRLLNRYLSLKDDVKGISWVKWDNIISCKKIEGINVGGLLAENLSLLGKWKWKWKWRFLMEDDALWKKLVRCDDGVSLVDRFERWPLIDGAWKSVWNWRTQPRGRAIEIRTTYLTSFP